MSLGKLRLRGKGAKILPEKMRRELLHTQIISPLRTESPWSVQRVWPVAVCVWHGLGLHFHTAAQKSSSVWLEQQTANKAKRERGAVGRERRHLRMHFKQNYSWESLNSIIHPRSLTYPCSLNHWQTHGIFLPHSVLNYSLRLVTCLPWLTATTPTDMYAHEFD